jgi:hypothetical protein
MGDWKAFDSTFDLENGPKVLDRAWCQQHVYKLISVETERVEFKVFDAVTFII